MDGRRAKEKDEADSDKDMGINWVNVATRLIAVSALVTVLVVNLLGPRFVEGGDGYIRRSTSRASNDD